MKFFKKEKKQNTSYKSLKEKIRNSEIEVTIIGFGYVGQSLAEAFLKKDEKIKLIGYDINKEKIFKLKKGLFWAEGVDFEYLLNNKRFLLTNNIIDIKESDVYIICIPTPIDEHKVPDLSYLKSAVLTIKKLLKEKEKLIVIESTVYPTTTRNLVYKLLESEQTKFSIDYYLGYSPERISPSDKHDVSSIPKIVSGLDQISLELTDLLYSKITKTIRVSSPEIAEAAKILENIYRAVNIALVNELKKILLKLDIDIFEVIEAAKTKPFGFQAFYPGPGMGGHCIPVDPFYLSYIAKEIDLDSKFIELAGQINHEMPDFIVQQILKVSAKINKPIKDQKILVVGVSYKKNVSDTRETPAKKIIQRLKEYQFKIDILEPYVQEFESIKCLNEIKNNMKYDISIIITDHDLINYSLLEKISKYIVDTRGRFKISKKIIRA